MKLLMVIWQIPRYLVKAMVRFYQLALSPMLGRSCRYYPSCSNYMIQAIDKHGAVKGVIKGVFRICRCHPWSKGGVDFP